MHALAKIGSTRPHTLITIIYTSWQQVWKRQSTIYPQAGVTAPACVENLSQLVQCTYNLHTNIENPKHSIHTDRDEGSCPYQKIESVIIISIYQY